jgi:hypothetical protein
VRDNVARNPPVTTFASGVRDPKVADRINVNYYSAIYSSFQSVLYMWKGNVYAGGEGKLTGILGEHGHGLC